MIKSSRSGRAVNVTLALPIIRTSVDHGTALSLAGTGQADPSSLVAALDTALEMARSALATAINGQGKNRSGKVPRHPIR